ncbi:hypothetical protein Tco_0232743 [Tanacetum coccineum]
MLIDSIVNRPFQLKKEIAIPGVNSAADEKRAQIVADLSPVEKIRYDYEIKATNSIHLGLPVDIYTPINHFQTAKKYGNIEGRQSQGYGVDSGKSPTIGMMGTNTVSNVNANQSRVVRCYNCRGEGNIVKQCTIKKRVKDVEWFKEKILLAQAQEAGVILHKDQQDFLAYRLEDMDDCDDLQLHTTSNFKADHVDAYNSDYDNEATACAIFMASLYPAGSINGDIAGPSYDSELLLEVFTKRVNDCASCSHLEIELLNQKESNKSFNELSNSFTKLEKHCISLELSLQNTKEDMICNEPWKVNEASLITKINNKSFEITNLKAQLQEKSIVVNELKQLLATLKEKSQMTLCEPSDVYSRF